jgi:hypothetical protein
LGGLNGRGGFEDSKIQGFKDSRIQGFKDSKIQGFKDSRIQRFKDSRIQGFWSAATVPRMRDEDLKNLFKLVAERGR